MRTSGHSSLTLPPRLSTSCGHAQLLIFSTGFFLPFLSSSPSRPRSMATATAAAAATASANLFTKNHTSTTFPLYHKHHNQPHVSRAASAFLINCHFTPPLTPKAPRAVLCKATDVSVTEESPSSGGENWVPVVPLTALPKGERRVIIQDGETILLLWYKDRVFAIENRSPAEGAYSEGLINAKLTQDGCIVCPTTDSTFDLQTGAIRDWYPKNPVLRVLTPALRTLFIYPVKIDEENIYISMRGGVKSDSSAEIVFSGRAQPGVTATDVNVDEVRMVVDEDLEGFGFTSKNELINGKAAIIGFLFLIDFELLTGKGLLKGTGFLDFIYSISNAFN